jgi:DNA-binding transcriptional LysR family regulator
MAFSRNHRLAQQETISIENLKTERFLLRSHCENGGEMSALLLQHGLNTDRRHEVSSDQDLIALLEANIGIGFLPRSVTTPLLVTIFTLWADVESDLSPATARRTAARRFRSASVPCAWSCGVWVAPLLSRVFIRELSAFGVV